jgi:hypothetical protein
MRLPWRGLIAGFENSPNNWRAYLVADAALQNNLEILDLMSFGERGVAI